MKNRLVGRCLFVLLLLGSGFVIAAGLTTTWTNPTANTDSSVIPATGPGSLASGTITYGPCSADGKSIATVAGTIPAAAGATSGSVPNLTPGTWCAGVQVTNTYGNQSAMSNIASKTIAAPTPSAPTNFSLN